MSYNYSPPPQRGGGGLGPWVWVLVGVAGVAVIAVVLTFVLTLDNGDNGNQPIAQNGGAQNNANVAAKPDFDLESIPIGLAIGQRAPEIEGEDIDGVTFKLSDYRGKVVVLDFWGDW